MDVRTTSGTAPMPRDDRRRLLLVDDNDDAAMLLGQYLEQSGYDVRIASTAEAALAQLDDWAPDLAILDIGLPGTDGYELARLLRARPELADLRLIALTGYGTPDDRQRARQAGFDHHLTKPASIATLVRLLGGG